GEPGLAILFPEEARIGEPRREHLAVARDDFGTAIARIDIRGADKAVGKLAARSVHDKIFLVHARGELDDLRRHFQKGLVEAAEKRYWPLGEARILDHQPLILDKGKASIGCGLSSAAADDRRAFFMVDNDMAGAKLLGIVGRRPDRDLAWTVEAMA